MREYGRGDSAGSGGGRKSETTTKRKATTDMSRVKSKDSEAGAVLRAAAVIGQAIEGAKIPAGPVSSWPFMPETQSGQHTPGPWKSVNCEVQTDTDEPRLIADLGAIRWNFGEAAANARLIAAAPDLLEALDQCQRYIGLLTVDANKVYDIDWHALHQQARAAIEKAGAS